MNTSDRYRCNEAQNKVLDYMDYVTDVIPTPDFVEVHGKAGGDDVCYRVMNDGNIYEE